MRFPQGAEWLIILVLILLLFGAKRLPDAARGLGRSLRILKSETKGLRDDDEQEEQTPPAAQALPASPAVDISDTPAVDVSTPQAEARGQQ